MEQIQILTLADEQEWSSLLERIPGKDLAHFPHFSRVYEKYGEGKAECFVFRQGDHLVMYPYILRKLDCLPFTNGQFNKYFDIITPYCYGGFIHNAQGEEEASRLIKGFRHAFENHARETNIVSEFIRFDPMLRNHLGCNGLFSKLFLHQNNIVIDLKQDEETLLKQCRPTFRRYIQKASISGLRLERVDPESNLDLFAEMYRETMLRHDQTGYLDFPKSYFRELLTNLRNNILMFTVRLGDKTAAASLFFKFNDKLDYFLGASEEKLLPLRPNHFMFHKASCWAREHGYHRLHLGGGRDSLMYFKRGFSKLTAPFYIAHKVHDQKVYESLTALRQNSKPDIITDGADFFPAYRQGLE